MSAINMDDFICPITMEVMIDPVMAPDGSNYERSAIDQWLVSHGSSPKTRQYMSTSQLVPNYTLKEQIQRLKLSNAINSIVVPEFVNALSTYQTISSNGMLHIKITPPDVGSRQPIVLGLAIDTSGSMDTIACDISETGGKAFTRLDLVKHTVRTIIGMLNSTDILFIVSFNQMASIRLHPTLMTEDGKKIAETKLSKLVAGGQTNIWDSLRLLNKISLKPEFAGRNICTAVLTDGVSNIDPPRGIVESLKLLTRPETLSTFGFGYELDSKILNEIATIGKGSFGFIPDYSMVGTVFINWCATCLATASLNMSIPIEYLTIQTGLIQYGQTRDFYIPLTPLTDGIYVPGSIEPFILCKNEIENAILHILYSATRINTTELEEIYTKYSASTDPKIIELLRDIKPIGSDDEGQVHMAPRYFDKWGKHYLRAYLKAHQQQQCMNFKDPGLQIYGGTLFKEIQSQGDMIFADLPALEPTGQAAQAVYGMSAYVANSPSNQGSLQSMSQMFHNSGGGCFDGRCKVLMADSSRVPIANLDRGDMVMCPDGPAKVVALVIIGSNQPSQLMCKIGNCIITPWHPVLINNKWVNPASFNIPHDRPIQTVYNLVLDRGHIINVESVECITLAHHFNEEGAKHDYFGTDKVIEDLKKCAGWSIGRPAYANLKSTKDPITGLINGWVDSV